MCIRDSSQSVFSHTLSLPHLKDIYLYNSHIPSYPLSPYTVEPNNHPPNPVVPLHSSNIYYISYTAIPPPLYLPSATFPFSHHPDLRISLFFLYSRPVSYTHLTL